MKKSLRFLRAKRLSALIGHAKSILLNYGLAEEYHGKFHMRFDDTNPTKEKVEFVESIKADIQWLGADWGDSLFFI